MGTELDFQAEPDGSLRARVLARGADSLFGLLHELGRTVRSPAQMHAGMAAGVKARAKP